MVVEQLAFVEDFGLGRIQILGTRLAQRSTAEAHDAATLVGDREHDPMPEPVEALAAAVGLGQHAGRQQLGLRKALAHQRPPQRGALVGRVAEPEAPHDLPAEAAPLQVGLRLLAAGARELGLKPGGGRGVGRMEALAGLGLARRRAPRCGDAGEIGQALQRLGKAQSLDRHDEVDGGPVRATAEAVIEALVLDHVERGRLLLVERAQALMLAAPAGQLDIAADDLGQGQPGLEVLERVLSASHRRRHCDRWRCKRSIAPASFKAA